MKVAYNHTLNGFRLDADTVARFNELRLDFESKIECDYDAYLIPRHDPDLIQAVEECELVGGGIAIRELTGDRYYIQVDANGRETVVQPDDIQWVTARPGLKQRLKQREVET